MEAISERMAYVNAYAAFLFKLAVVAVYGSAWACVAQDWKQWLTP